MANAFQKKIEDPIIQCFHWYIITLFKAKHTAKKMQASPVIFLHLADNDGKGESITKCSAYCILCLYIFRPLYGFIYVLSLVILHTDDGPTSIEWENWERDRAREWNWQQQPKKNLYVSITVYISFMSSYWNSYMWNGKILI